MSFVSRVTASPRLLLLVVAAACLAAVGGALVAQHRFDMLPCPWCTLQRLIFLVLAAVCLLAALVSPLRRLLAGLGVLLAACGIGASLWLHFVASSSASCALTMADRIMQALGLYDLAPEVFAPMASCADAAVDLLGIPFAMWSLALFALCGAACVPALRARRN
jgi:disulfide bond formation protein DsbB